MQQVPTGEAPKAEGRTSWEQAAWLRRQQAVVSKQASHINRKGKAFRRHQEGAAELGSVPNVGVLGLGIWRRCFLEGARRERGKPLSAWNRSLEGSSEEEGAPEQSPESWAPPI